MKKIISLLLAVVLAFSISLTSFAYVSGSQATTTRNEAKTTIDELVLEKFDVNSDEKIAAADARLILLYSAGLRNDETACASTADVDGDSIVSAIDARICLRVSAQLESAVSYCSTEEQLEYFNAILNVAKPNNYNLYKNGIEYTANVTYTDPKGVVSALDKAFQKMDSSMSFADELVAGKGEKSYNQNTTKGSVSTAKNRMMTIYNSDGMNEYLSSYLTVDDITGIEYKTNQTYTFTRYGTSSGQINTSNVLYTETVTGLDSMTVYLKSDATIDGEHASKAFTTYDKEELEQEVANVADQFNSMSTDLSLLGTMQFDVTPSLGGITYYNGYITIYFYPDTAEIVAAYYSIYTDYTMGLYMDVDITIPLYAIYVDVAGQVNITNTTESIYEYYFIRNNENHIDW